MITEYSCDMVGEIYLTSDNVVGTLTTLLIHHCRDMMAGEHANTCPGIYVCVQIHTACHCVPGAHVRHEGNQGGVEGVRGRSKSGSQDAQLSL